MKTILFSTFGTMGDVNPFIALAHAVEGRGARAEILTNPGLAPFFEREGLAVRGVGEPVDVFRFIAENPRFMGVRGGEYVLREVFIPLAAPIFAETRRAMAESPVAAVVSHPFSFGSVWAARAAGVPAAVVHLAPVSLFSREDVRQYRPMVRAFYRRLIPAAFLAASRWMRGTCRDLGVAWSRRVFEETVTEPDLLLGLWSPRFSGPVPPDRRAAVCGFPAPRAEAPAAGDDVSAFLSAGEPPVLFCLGSSAVNCAGGFFGEAARAAAMLGVRALAVRGPDPVRFDGPGMLAVERVSFPSIFPRCAAVVHHGGIGTMADGLRAGVPAVVIPHGHDQFDNAARLERLGVSRTLPRRGLTARRLAAALGRVLAAPVRERAAALGADFRAEVDGAGRAAEAILSLAAAGSIRPRAAP